MYNTILQRAFSARRKGLEAFVGKCLFSINAGRGMGRGKGFAGVQCKFTERPEKTEKTRPAEAGPRAGQGSGEGGGEWAGGGGEWGGGGGAGQWGRWLGMSGKRRLSALPRQVSPSPAPQNSSPTSKQGQAFAANSLWPCTVARGKRRRSRSTSASSAMRCEGVRVSFGEPSLASRPPM